MTETKAKPQSTAAHDVVPFREKLAYGLGAVPSLFGGAGVKTLAIPVYQMVLGVNPALLGIVLAIPRLWDAFTDPLMGRISDNFQSRWGRRRPFIFIGAILSGLTFGLIWMVPEGWGQNATLAYFIATSLLFYTAFTIFSVPLHSLGYELTADYNERTSVQASWSYFVKIAAFLYNWTFPFSQYLVVIGLVAGTMASVRLVGWGIGIFVIIGLGLIPAVFTRERYYHKVNRTKKVKVFESIGAAMKNRAFAVLVFISMAIAAAGMLTSNLDYYLLVYFVHNGDLAIGSYWKGIISSGYAVCGFLWIYPLMRLSKVIGKKACLTIVFSMCAVGGILKWFIFTPGTTWLILLDPILCAPIFVGMGMLAESMMADVCDDDELLSGTRREGMFGAIFSWIKKLGFSMSFLVSGLALNWIAFDSRLGGDQSEETFTWMRLCVAGAATISSVLGLIVLSFYPITPASALETRVELERRRGAV